MAAALTAPFVMHGARDAITGGLTHVEQQVNSITVCGWPACLSEQATSGMVESDA